MQRNRWLVIALGLVLVMVLGFLPRQGAMAQEMGGAASAQLVIGGKVVGSFTEVSGLDIQVEVLEVVCQARTDGRDDDCDGIAAETWQADLLTSLWGIEAVLAELEGQAWLSSRAKHDIAMNAIRNIKARIHETTHTIQQGGSLQARHDTSKNAIGNIRALYRVLGDVGVNEPGVNAAALREMGRRIDALEKLAAQRTIRKKPGRTTYANITLEARVGQNQELAAWWNEMASGKIDRKSGSIIYLDREGNEVLRYNFFEAWPVSMSTSMAVEKIELAVEKVERAR